MLYGTEKEIQGNGWLLSAFLTYSSATFPCQDLVTHYNTMCGEDSSTSDGGIYLFVRIHALQYRVDEPSFGGLSSEETTHPDYRWRFPREGGVHYAAASKYKVSVRFWKYDGGCELSSRFSV